MLNTYQDISFHQMWYVEIITFLWLLRNSFNFFFVISSKVAVPDVLEASADADILIFVLPHQFMKNVCKPLVGKIKSSAFGVSLCKVLIMLKFKLKKEIIIFTRCSTSCFIY